jgi:hypothetical protein
MLMNDGPPIDRARARPRQLATAPNAAALSLERASLLRSVLRKPTLGRARDLRTAPESASRACAQMRMPRPPSARKSLDAGGDRLAFAASRRLQREEAADSQRRRCVKT